jgi:hypothetical protein
MGLVVGRVPSTLHTIEKPQKKNQISIFTIT